MAGYHNARVTNRQRATFVNGLNKISEKEREGEIAYSFWLRTKRKIAKKFPYIYIYMYKAEDRRKDRRYRFGEISILFERMLKVIKGELQFS